MPTDIRMPDGTIIRNVPDGTPRAEIERRWRSSLDNRKTANHPVAGPILSGLQGAADMLTLGFDDEIGAARDTIDPFNPNSGWRKGFGAAFRENQRRRQARKDELASVNPKSSIAGSMAGAILPAVLTGGGSLAATPRAAAQGGRVARAARALAPTVAQSAAYGVGSGSGTLGDRVKRVPEAVAYGVAGDLAGRGLGKVASRLIGGKRVPANVRKLADEGIVLTPGQRAGKGSLRNTFEDKVLGSIPFVSDVPAAAARRGENDLRVAVANRVLSPVGQKIERGTPINNEAIGAIQDMVGKAYDDAIAPLSLRIDDTIAAQLDDIVGTAQREVGPDAASQVGAYANYIKGRLAEGLTGEPLKREIQNLRGVASGSMGKDPMLGSKFWDIHNVLDEGLSRQGGAGVPEAYRNAREAQTLLSRMNDAASRGGVTNGEFGPTQLLQAAKKRGYGTTTANVASGEARLMDLANAAADVMRNKTANSGTPGRLLAGGLGLGGATTGAAMIDPLMGGATAASLLGYIPGVDRALQNAALNRPDVMRRVADVIERNNRSLGLLGTGGALGVFGR